ncbi:MAG: ATP-binding protein [Desulfobacterales bacterium]|nr:ATP-binding protein [Desulfobacterales bacterium]MDX2511207.1 ATP-binding protein [Desulfobacterales bacterium]
MIAKPNNKNKSFKLYKYFSITSFIFIFIGTIVLSYLNTHWARELQLKKNEEYAQLLVSNLNHQIFRQFVIPMSLRYGKIQLRDKNQYERMDTIVRGTLHGYNIEMVNMYDLNDIIAYSFDRELMGIKDIGGHAYQKAVMGVSTSEIEQNGDFWEIVLGIPKTIKVTTFAPLRAEKSLASITGPIIGVIEITQDITESYLTIFNFQILVIITIMAVMSLLFLILIFVVKRGEAIIEQRAKEQLRLKEQLNRAEHLSTIGEMVAGVSHEIRNPLGIIRSSADLLKKKMASYDASSTIPDIIIEEGERLNNIITDFLNFARPRQPNLIACRIEEVLEKNLNFIAAEAKNAGYRLATQFAHGLPDIMADKDMLYQAFLNILINAMQSMPDGGGIQIRIATEDDRVKIQFLDEGQGIAEKINEKIWDPFFTTKEMGTGLGLGIVKNIIESHNGVVHIENRPVRGVVVTVELPVR